MGLGFSFGGSGASGLGFRHLFAMSQGFLNSVSVLGCIWNTASSPLPGSSHGTSSAQNNIFVGSQSPRRGRARDLVTTAEALEDHDDIQKPMPKVWIRTSLVDVGVATG